MKLRAQDRQALKDMLTKGSESVRVIKRAMVLIKMDTGLSSNQAATAVGVTPETARKVGWRYITGGLDDSLYERPRPGNPPLLSDRQKKELISIACSEPPRGQARWSTATLAAEVMRRQIVPYVSKETIRVYLSQADLKPWREKKVVHSR
ncbi:MAG: helix-turn-helix domain-containing protein [Spirochaetales bacterium]|nr:helix-turn-helix domain-containing protein [Spirochaetales bacterium]